MIQCPECDHSWTDSTKGRHKCPNCYTQVMIIHGEARIIEIQRPKIESTRKGSIITRTPLDSIESSKDSLKCRVCKLPITSYDEGRNTHHAGLVHQSCYFKLPIKLKCSNCLEKFDLPSNKPRMCKFCESGEVTEVPVFEQDWRKNMLPAKEIRERIKKPILRYHDVEDSEGNIIPDGRNLVSDGSYLGGSKVDDSTSIVVKGVKSQDNPYTATKVDRPGVITTRSRIIETKIRFKKG